MQCPKCDNDEWIKEPARFTPEIKDQTVEFIVVCKVCSKCKTPMTDSEQMNLLRRTAADTYRAKNNLLTSAQIIVYRNSLGMSQAAFARYLKIGEASIKRWETYFIQDESQDDHMRLKCDEAYAEMNFLNVHWKNLEPDLFSGNKKFNLQQFKQVALFLVQVTGESIIYLNKLHFYADFLHFRKSGVSLTGARYVPLKYGPCPDQYRAIYDNLVTRGVLEEKSDCFYEAKTPPDLSLLDDSEKETLDQLCTLYRKHGAKKLYDLSHKELGYKETAECTFISYAYSENLLLPP